MEKRHGLYQDGYGDTLPDPGAEKRANGDLGAANATSSGRTVKEAGLA